MTTPGVLPGVFAFWIAKTGEKSEKKVFCSFYVLYNPAVLHMGYVKLQNLLKSNSTIRHSQASILVKAR